METDNHSKRAGVKKSVRLPGNFMRHVEQCMSYSGRSLSGEVVALVEQGLLLNQAGTLSANGDQGSGTGDKQSGTLCAVTFPQHIFLILDKSTHFTDTNFSDQVRLALAAGLEARLRIIEIELNTSAGEMSYETGTVMSDSFIPNAGENKQADDVLELWGDFRTRVSSLIRGSAGFVNVTGRPGSGKSLLSGKLVRELNTRQELPCHYINLQKRHLPFSQNGKVLIWKRSEPYQTRQILVIDDADSLDADYLPVFVKQTNRLNVSLVMLSQKVCDFTEWQNLTPTVIDLDKWRELKEIGAS